MRLLVVVILAVAACDPDLVPPDAPPDAGGVDAPRGCVLPPDPGPFGEACTEASFPSVTLCHDGDGWCVNGRCELMCTGGAGCPGCPAATRERLSDRGACYCAR